MLKCRNAETRRELQAFRVDSPNLTRPASAYHSLHILVGVGKPPIFINRGACTPPFADRANLISEYGEYSVESIEGIKAKRQNTMVNRKGYAATACIVHRDCQVLKCGEDSPPRDLLVETISFLNVFSFTLLTKGKQICICSLFVNGFPATPIKSHRRTENSACPVSLPGK